MAKLINYQYLRTEVDISQNVPDTELDNPIKRAQEMLSMIIGEELFNELSAQHPNYVGANGELMAIIKPFLAWQAYQFWLPKANFKSHKSGIRVHKEENSDPATDEQMATLIRDAKMWCQTKKEQIVQYLEDHHESFPLYEYECGTNKRTGTGFHITAIGTKHHSQCECNNCRHGRT